jgi:trk system potassium uptake protein
MSLSLLPFLSFFRGSQSKQRQFAVIGLGRFGRAVCMTLHHLGYEVLGVDSNKQRVAQLLSDRVASHAVQIDSTEPAALQEAGLLEFDIVVVAIGSCIQESVVTTLNLKEGKVPYVVAKASSETHSKLLKRVGADQVVFPEHESGCILAQSLSQTGILERFELDPDHSIVEIAVPAEFTGKTISDIDLWKHYGLNLLAVCRHNYFDINPNPVTRLDKSSSIVVMGDNRNINQLPI